MIDDLNVPPIDVHKAEHAAAPKHDASDDIGINGKDIAAPIVDALNGVVSVYPLVTFFFFLPFAFYPQVIST